MTEPRDWPCDKCKMYRMLTECARCELARFAVRSALMTPQPTGRDASMTPTARTTRALSGIPIRKEERERILSSLFPIPTPPLPRARASAGESVQELPLVIRAMGGDGRYQGWRNPNATITHYLKNPDELDRDLALQERIRVRNEPEVVEPEPYYQGS